MEGPTFQKELHPRHLHETGRCPSFHAEHRSCSTYAFLPPFVPEPFSSFDFRAPQEYRQDTDEQEPRLCTSLFGLHDVSIRLGIRSFLRIISGQDPTLSTGRSGDLAVFRTRDPALRLELRYRIRAPVDGQRRFSSRPPTVHHPFSIPGRSLLGTDRNPSRVPISSTKRDVPSGERNPTRVPGFPPVRDVRIRVRSVPVRDASSFPPVTSRAETESLASIRLPWASCVEERLLPWGPDPGRSKETQGRFRTEEEDRSRA